MPSFDRLQKNHLYTVFFAPRGYARLADLGVKVAQQYLSPFDKLVGIVGDAGSGKSMLIKGMFPGLEPTNDDDGVNVRPLPLLSVLEDHTGFYSPHTYHVDVRFETAFTQPHLIAEAIMQAVGLGKRVVIEHFDLIFPFLDRNADLLIGIGEEVIITRPTLFGPEPKDVADIVFKSIKYRRMTHTAEDLCEFCMKRRMLPVDYIHSDVRHGFILGFVDKPDIDLETLESEVMELIRADIPVSYLDDHHILLNGHPHPCSGPRMHVKSAGEIGKLTLLKEMPLDPITNLYLLVGLVGDVGKAKISDLNKISPGGV